MTGSQSTGRWPVLPVLVAVLCVALAGCGCDEEEPTIAVVNNTSGVVSAYVETSDGTILDYEEVQSGVTTGEQTISTGVADLALIWGDIPVPFYMELQAEYCYDYEIRFTGDSVRIVPLER